MPATEIPIYKKYKQKRIGLVNWVGLYTLCEKEIFRFIKVWTQTLLAPCVTTLLFMAIFVWALGGTGRGPQSIAFGDFLAPGLIIMAVIQNAFQNPASSILIAKVSGSITDVLMPPLSPLELEIGFAFGGVFRGVLVGLTVWILFSFWPELNVGVSHLWAVIYFMFSASLMLSFIGIITGVWAEKFDHGSAVTNFIITPLSLLSGTFYSITRLPEILQDISHYNPFFYLIDGFRYGFIGQADSDILTGVIFIGVLNISLALFVYFILKSGYKLKA